MAREPCSASRRMGMLLNPWTVVVKFPAGGAMEFRRRSEAACFRRAPGIQDPAYAFVDIGGSRAAVEDQPAQSQAAWMSGETPAARKRPGARNARPEGAA